METRRAFLGHLGIAAIGLTQLDRLVPALPGAKLNRIGIQLYTVRRQASADLAGTLAQIAKIGYKEVEFAGYYGHAASDVRAMLDRNGLVAPSGHIAYEAIMNAPDQTFADAKTVGQEWITVPSLPRGKHVTVDDWKRVAAQFNDAAKKAHDAGFRFAFHNHNDIVREQGGVLPIEILMHETDPALVNYQMDIYWAVSGGSDPLDLLARYPGRFKMFHVKDGRAPWTDASQNVVGQGTIDFKPIFAKAKGIEHYFVESDSAADPIAFADASYKYLSNLEY
ncbi:MAG TPA: sugar phosphate isomerase/epimerase [Gemmatimonadaceae bacterium]|nr:sugar phosphate isomerase/epimerase [Gemmatimonadaceae bacterium]